MSEQLTLPAETRERAGKGASRALRREGRVPAVVYGEKKEPLSVHVEEKLLTKMMSNGHFMNTIVMVEVGGKPNRTLPKDVQFHPVTSRPIHVDFLRIGEHAQVSVTVPLVFEGEADAPGLEGEGVLNVVLHELAIRCDASEIPGEIRVSVAGLDKGASLHLSAVQLPAGVVYAGTDEDPTLATIAAPLAETADELDEADVAPDAVPSEQGTTDSEG